MGKTIIYSIIIILLATVAYASLTDELISYWTFDDADTAGGASFDKLNHINLQIVNATTGHACIINECYEYNGSTDYLQVAHNSYQELTQHFTITAWVKAYSYPIFSGNDQNYIVHKGNSDFDDGHYGIRSDTEQKISSKIRIGGSSKITQGTTVMKANEWYFTTMVFNGTHLKTYMNCTEEGTPTAVSAPLNISTDNFFIATANQNPFLYRWNGTIDEVGIWNRTLTDAEICQVYNSGDGLQYPFTSLNCTVPSAGTWNVPNGCQVNYADMIEYTNKGYDILWENILVTT